MSSGVHRHQRLGLVLVAVLACSGAGLLFKGLGLGSGFSVGIPDPLSIPSLEAPTSSGGSALGPAHGLGLDGRAPAGAPGQPGMVQPGRISVRRPQARSRTSSRTAACPGCDVVLITVCSLRKDHLGAYGFESDVSPAIDALAQRGVRYERAYSASNFTLASLTAVLTGRMGARPG